MKARTLFTVALLLVAMVAVGQAQRLSVSSTPVTLIRNDGQAEKVGTVTFTEVDGVAMPAGTITIDFTVPVNNVAGDLPTASVGTIAVSGNTVVITLAAGDIGASGSLTVANVRIDASGGVGQLDAQISTTGLNIVAGQFSTRVVNGSAAPFTIGGTGDGAAFVLNDGTTGAVVGQLTIKEGFVNAFTTAAQESTAAANGFQLVLTVTGIPTGATLTLADGGSTGTLTAAGFAALSSTSPSATISFTATDPAAKENLVISMTWAKGTATVPLTPQSITGTITSAPQTSTVAPRFVKNDQDVGTVLTIGSLSTNLLFEFATRVSSANFDTGIAIANTSADPLSATNTAAPTSGTVTFNLFNNDGSAAATYTTTATSAGAGLDANGEVAAGSTYSVLLSEILTAAGVTGDFTGYIIAVCNFTHAHGVAFTSNFTDFTQGTAALVIPNTARSAAVATGEVLGH